MLVSLIKKRRCQFIPRNSKLSISKGFSVCYMEYFMYSSMLCQRKVRNIIKEPRRVNLPGTFKLLAIVREMFIFMRHSLTNKKSFRKF